MRYRRVRVAGAAYFFTLVTHRRMRLFDDPAMVTLYRDASNAVRQRHPFETVAEVVLPDHLHAVWQLPDDDVDYPLRWRLIKSAFTRAYLALHEAPDVSTARAARGEQAVWQRRYWEHTMIRDDDVWRHIDYVHLNPVHHGYVSAAKDWPHSSFRDFVARGIYGEEWGTREVMAVPAWASRHE